MVAKVFRCCFACIRSVPVVFITAVICWSYYAYVVQLSFYAVTSLVERFFYLLIFHPLLVMMMWSYYKSIFTPVATPPMQFYLSHSDLDRLNSESSGPGRREVLNQIGRKLPVMCRTLNGEMRYCERCKAIRPDRAHHCSVCGTYVHPNPIWTVGRKTPNTFNECILKMDHHCPWVNNCVNFSNYKFFMLFLGYALSYSLYVALTALPYFILFWKDLGSKDKNLGNLHIVFLFFAGIMFSISLASLFGYHIYLVSKNKSTLESFQVPVFSDLGPEKNAFNIGCYRNFIQVFGVRRLYWFLPIFTSSGDGVTYVRRCDDESRSSLLGPRQRWVEQGRAAGDNTESEEENLYDRAAA